MKAIKRSVEIEIEPTAEELAKTFSDSDGDFQARFFNEIFEQSRLWDAPFSFQALEITDSEELTDGGRYIMRTIGEYSEQVNGGR